MYISNFSWATWEKIDKAIQLLPNFSFWNWPVQKPTSVYYSTLCIHVSFCFFNKVFSYELKNCKRQNSILWNKKNLRSCHSAFFSVKKFSWNAVKSSWKPSRMPFMEGSPYKSIWGHNLFLQKVCFLLQLKL